MSDTHSSIPLLLCTGALQVLLLCGGVLWLARGTSLRFRWLRMIAFALALCSLSLPLVAVLVWHPPEDPGTRHNLVLAIGLVPCFVGYGVAFIRIYQLERQKRRSKQRAI